MSGQQHLVPAEGRRCTANPSEYCAAMGAAMCSAGSAVPEIFHNMMVCPPAHGRSPAEKLALVLKAFSLQVVLTLISWTISFVLLLMCCGAVIGVDFFAVLLTLVGFWWVLSFTVFPRCAHLTHRHHCRAR
jgi:hypothetical protein